MKVVLIATRTSRPRERKQVMRGDMTAGHDGIAEPDVQPGISVRQQARPSVRLDEERQDDDDDENQVGE